MKSTIDAAMLREFGRAILHPGLLVPRGTANDDGRLETQTRWSARAVASIVEQLFASAASTNRNLMKLLHARDFQVDRERQEGNLLRAEREQLLWLLAEARHLAGQGADLGDVTHVCVCGARSGIYAHDVANPLCVKHIAPVDSDPYEPRERIRHTLFGLVGSFDHYGPNGEVHVDVANRGRCSWVPHHVERVTPAVAVVKAVGEAS